MLRVGWDHDVDRPSRSDAPVPGDRDHGALYHVDLYVVCDDLESGRPGPGENAGFEPLEAGVYHFDPRTLSLDVLREGDYRGVLAEAAAHDGVEAAPLSIVATSTWWRNAWKYGNRTFRHAFWDLGIREPAGGRYLSA